MLSHRKSCKSVAPVVFAEHRDRQTVDTLSEPTILAQ
jgi:hypothetical protein